MSVAITIISTLVAIVAIPTGSVYYIASIFTKSTRHRKIGMGGLLGGLCAIIILVIPDEHTSPSNEPRAQAIPIAKPQQVPVSPTVSPPKQERASEKSAGTIGDGALYISKKSQRYLMPLLKEGAEQLIHDPKCPLIEYADVSTEIWPKDNPKFFYGCNKDGNLFVVKRTKSEILVSRKLASSQVVPNPVSAGTAIVACKEFIRAHANNPSTVDIHVLDIATNEYPNGRVGVEMGFSAKNAFGVEADLHARCIVMPGGKIEGSIGDKSF